MVYVPDDCYKLVQAIKRRAEPVDQDEGEQAEDDERSASVSSTVVVPPTSEQAYSPIPAHAVPAHNPLLDWDQMTENEYNELIGAGRGSGNEADWDDAAESHLAGNASPNIFCQGDCPLEWGCPDC